MSQDSKGKIIGPSLPPGYAEGSAFVPESKEKGPASKKIFGPLRPPTLTNDAPIPVKNRSRSRSPPPCSEKKSYSKILASRESWMTELDDTPSVSNVDPLKIKSRTFIQKRSSDCDIKHKVDVINPEVKEKEKKIDEQIREYNETFRQQTLQEIYEEEHMAGKKAETDADRSSRIFDWERDMNSNVRQMSTKSAKDLLNQSKLNDRFGSSSSKKYL